jgi:type II secretory pathway pseudopilin PulG
MRRPSKRAAARVHAFTLIEVTMAGAILAVGAAGVLAAYSTTMGLIEHQRRLATAVNVTSSKLEDLLVAGKASSLLTPGTNGPEILDGLGRPPPIGSTDTYEVRWTVTADVPAAGYLQIVVETRWVELRGSRFTRFAAYREQ